MYTSGTSGKSKAVPLSWENLVASALASAVNLGLHFDDVWLCCLPVNHIGGLSILLRSAIYGTAVEIQNGFEVDAVSQSIATNATLVSLVPTMLHRLIRDRKFEASLGSSRLRGILLGGASANLDDVTWCRARGVKVFHTYGMTESASQITTAHPEAPVGCSGLPVRGASVSIRDANFRELAPGEVGTIHISGPMVMRGYLGHPEENMRRFREGWFDTNDVGYLDKYGQLYVLSRREDLIVSGGENVYPAEVESVLLEHPEVAEVAVFGLPDEEWGQLVCAAIVWRSEPVELDSWLLARLAKFKHPRRRYALDGLPKTSSGKVMRAKLREMFLTSGV
jgi:O-succinylbenzoic acid--CoA ligase